MNHARRAGVMTLLCLALSLAACGRATDRPRDAAASTLQPRAGGLAPPGTAADRYWQLFAKRVRERSGARIDPVLLTHGEIGSDEQILQGLRRNRIQLAVNGAHAISGVVPEFAVLGLPFLFESDEEAEYVASEHLFTRLDPLLRAHGLRLLRLIPMGFHNVYAQKPLRVPDDLRGLRVRQPADAASTAYARALGLDLAPLPASEIVTALQTGMIQAGTTVTLNYLWGGIADDAPVLVLTRHAYLFNAVLANDDWWQSLPEADRTLLDAAFGSTREYVELMRTAEQQDLDAALARKALTLVTLGDEERRLWQAPALSVRAQTVDSIGAEAAAVLEACLAGKRAWMAKQRGATRDGSPRR